MHMSLDRRDGGSTQVLPQFRDTKLGNIRLWKATVPVKSIDVESDWRTILLYFVINITCLTTGLILLIPLDLNLAGSVLMGIWGMLTLIGIICVILLTVRLPPVERKPDTMEMDVKSKAKDWSPNFYIDPVMRYAITDIVYHGPEDCELCRARRLKNNMEHRPENFTKENQLTEMHTYPYQFVPTNRMASVSRNTSPTSPTMQNTEGSQITKTGQLMTDVKEQPQTKLYPVISYADVISGDDMVGEDFSGGETNLNFNNNNINKTMSSSMRAPRLVITPPDVTPCYDDVTTTSRPGNIAEVHMDRMSHSMTPSNFAKTKDDYVTKRIEVSKYQKKQSRRSNEPRRSVSNRKRGPVQKSLQRIRDQNHMRRTRSSKRNWPSKRPLDVTSPSFDFMTSPRRHNQGDVNEAGRDRREFIVVNLESSL